MSLNQEDFHTRWQQLHLQVHHLVVDEGNKEDPSHIEKQADSVRNIIAQLQLARLSKFASSECCSMLFHQQTAAYGTTMDNPPSQHGLDNFAELALAQTEGKPNESQSWRSGLSLDNVCEKDYIKDYLQVTPAVPDAILPCGRTTTVSKKDPVIPSTRSANAEHVLPRSTSSDATNPGPGTTHPTPVARGQHRAATEPSPFTRGHHHTDPSPFTRGHHHTEPEVSESGRPQGFWNLSRQDGAAWGGSGGERGGSGAERGGSGYRRDTWNTDNGSARGKRPSCQPMKRQWESGEDVAPPDEDPPPVTSAFRTAKQQLILDDQKKNRGGSYSGSSYSSAAYGTNKKSLGTRRGLNSKFVPPVLGRDDEDTRDGDSLARHVTSTVLGNKAGAKNNTGEEIIDERLKNLDPKMVELIMNEIMDHGPTLTWDDIAGLEFAKKTIKEIVVWPMLRPDIFTGLRGPPKGLLLFGPPGTGKTLIGKCIASQSKSTFFSISASSLTSKWVGEGEKMVRALFGVARVHQPAVIFIDEIDSLLSQRTDGEHEASRRIKTEFLVQLDGATTDAEDRILVVGATNRPQEIDEAARRRFMKRLYIPLPEGAARQQIVVHLMAQQSHDLCPADHSAICTQTEGYSGSDMANLCREAALGPIRSMEVNDIEHITADQVRPIMFKDFQDALTQVRASVSQKDLDVYLEWNKQYGSWGVP